MKAICFYFQIHQPFRLKRYRFFDIGNSHYYYDDFANDDIITRIAHRSYIPAAESLLRMIKDTRHTTTRWPRWPTPRNSAYRSTSTRRKSSRCSV